MTLGEIIKWCNENNGFLTALLALLSLFLSAFAIAVSIQTARLPYKKSLKLSVYTPLQTSFFDDGKVRSELAGIDINVVNTGNQDVLIVFLGLGIKCKKRRYEKVYDLNSEWAQNKQISPAQLYSIEYKKDALSRSLSEKKQTLKVYAYAEDSEGKVYKSIFAK